MKQRRILRAVLPMLILAAGCASQVPAPPAVQPAGTARNMCMVDCRSDYLTVLRECELFLQHENRVAVRDPLFMRCLAKNGYGQGRDTCSARCGP